MSCEFDSHPQMSVPVLNYYVDFVKRMMADTSKSDLRASYALGLAGEAAELQELISPIFNDSEKLSTRDDLVAEMGDCAHYIFGLSYLYGFHAWSLLTEASAYLDRVLMMNRADRRDMMDAALPRYVFYACQVADQVKKQVFHQKPQQQMQATLRNCLTNALCNYLVILADENVSLTDAMDNNIGKLKKRHGKSFQVWDKQNKDSKENPTNE